MITLMLYQAQNTFLRVPAQQKTEPRWIAHLKSRDDAREEVRIFLDRGIMMDHIGITGAQVIQWIKAEFPNFLKVDDIINVNGEFYISVNAEDLT